MVLDIKSIFTDAFIKFFDHIVWFVPVIIIIALYMFFFRNEIAYNWDLTKREKNRLTEKSFLAVIIIVTATIAYLYIKEYFFLLLVALSFVLTYILYLVGIFDMLVEKLEGRYGR